MSSYAASLKHWALNDLGTKQITSLHSVIPFEKNSSNSASKETPQDVISSSALLDLIAYRPPGMSKGKAKKVCVGNETTAFGCRSIA